MTSKVKPQPGLDHLQPYVPGTPIEEVQRKYGLRHVIKLASNENPLGTSPKALEAIQRELGRLNFYPDSQCYNLRQALAAHLQVDPEQLIIGNGADGIITQACMAYLDQDSEVVVSQSSFPVYDIFTHIMRARLVKTPLKDYRLDLEAMAAAITDKTKLIFVCNPNNPTGSIVTAAEVEAFMARVPDHVLVVFDEAYFELVASKEYPDTLRYVREGRENVMIMRTFSKVYGLAGLRLGYGIAMPSVLAPLNRAKESFAVNLLAQAAGVAALEDQEFLRKTVEMNHASRLWLYEQFDRLGLFYVESHTNFVLVEIGPEAGRGPAGAAEKGSHRPAVRRLRSVRLFARHRGHAGAGRPLCRGAGTGAAGDAGSTMKQRHFIDSHKAATGPAVLLLTALYKQWDNPTAWVYLGLHGTYGLLWLLKSRIFPDKSWERETGWGYGLTIWGGLTLYWIAPWLLTSRGVEAPGWYLGLCVALYALGVMFHFASDMQKHTALKLAPGRLIQDGLFRRCRNPNYFGELLIYLGFGLLAMHWLPLAVLAAYIAVVWLPNMRRKEQSLSRYPEFAAYQRSSKLFIPFLF